MTALLWGSAAVLAIAAVAATLIYGRAVTHGYRAYLHVGLAGIFVLAVEAYVLLDLPEAVLLITNLVGIGAMVTLASRFSPPADTAVAPEGRSLYVWYREHKGFVAFAAIVLLAAVGLLRVEAASDNANNAADEAHAAAESAAANAEKNRTLICSLGELISGSPVVRRPDETPREYTQRVRLLRRFADDLRGLDDCDPENPVRVRIPPIERKIIRGVRERVGEQRVQGGAVGTSGSGASSGVQPTDGAPIPAPDGGGGGGGSQDPDFTPPGQQPGPPSGGPPGSPPDAPPGLLDPVTDPICDLTSGLGVPLCL